MLIEQRVRIPKVLRLLCAFDEKGGKAISPYATAEELHSIKAGEALACRGGLQSFDPKALFEILREPT